MSWRRWWCRLGRHRWLFTGTTPLPEELGGFYGAYRLHWVCVECGLLRQEERHRISRGG